MTDAGSSGSAGSFPPGASGAEATFAGAVLTGGRSRRMGTDKALLEVAGSPLAATAADALLRAGATRVVAIGGDLVGLAALGLEAHADSHPDEGPLGGICTALGIVGEHHEIVVVLACDMPAIDAGIVRAVVDALRAAPEAAVAVPVLDGRRQILTAAYRSSARTALAASFDAGERAPRRALADLVVVEVDGLDPGALADVDRPDDLRRYAPHP